MPSWLFPARRAVEATTAQLVATGALGGYGLDPIDGDRHYKPAGTFGRPVPEWTLEKARAYSVAAYRLNPLAKAIVDTYTSFCVGDSGVTYTCSNPDVKKIVDEFWTDPANDIGYIQTRWLRDQMLMGELVTELLQGEGSGVVRISPTDPTPIHDVTLRNGNPLWPDMIQWPVTDGVIPEWRIVRVNDDTGLREGQAFFWAPWRTLITDRRGTPFLMTIMDWLDNYDQVLSNLIDRTALARYAALDVKITGSQADVDNFVRQRGGTHMPRSGSMEVHSDTVELSPITMTTGAEEDSVTAKNVMTLIAGGAGLAKTWLADPEDSNRATSLTMAEPVRRRVGGVQNDWVCQMTELCRFVVDRAVAAKRLPMTVQATDARTGDTYEVPAAMAVTVTGPEIAAADAQLTAGVMLNLATGLEKLVAIGALSGEAAALVAQKAWEDYMGVPFRAELAGSGKPLDDLATHVEETGGSANYTESRRLRRIS